MYASCRLPGADVSDRIGARDVWITHTPMLETSPGYTGTILYITNVVMYICVLELCC